MDQSASSTLLQDRYQLQTVLQQRDHTTTWVALDRQAQPDQPSVIVKILNMDQLQDWQAYERFEREALALKSLNHPSIPRLIDFFQVGQQAIVVQQYIHGETLRARIDKRWKLTEAQARTLARQALEILNAVHLTDPPLVHRDLKPENIMLDGADRLYIIDFGAVRQSTTTQHTVAGSFAYMAPEQLGGHAIPASDLYGLGMTLIELLSGSPLAELPREGLYVKFHEALNVSEGFKRWLDHMIAPYAVQRFASARVALEGLKKPEYLAVMEHRNTLSPSHGKQVLSPSLWVQEKPEVLTLEIHSETFNLELLVRATVWTLFFIGTFGLAFYYLSGWLSDALRLIPELRDLASLRDIIGWLLSETLWVLAYLWIHKRYVGVTYAKHQSLSLDNEALRLEFTQNRGLRKAKKTVRTYTRKNLREIRFRSHHIEIVLHRPQQGFRTHVITPQTLFTPAMRETLVEVIQKRGVSARV